MTCFVSQVVKYFMISSVILLANTSLHEKMLEIVVRSPGSYYDTTPSGVVLNKFSNDLGVADNSLLLSFIELLEGPSIFIVAILNLC